MKHKKMIHICFCVCFPCFCLFFFFGGFFSHVQLFDFGLKFHLIKGVFRNGVICLGLCKDPLTRLVKLYQTSYLFLPFISCKIPRHICLSVQIHTNHNLPPWKIPFNQLFFQVFHAFCLSLKYSLKEKTKSLFFGFCKR